MKPGWSWREARFCFKVLGLLVCCVLFHVNDIPFSYALEIGLLNSEKEEDFDAVAQILQANCISCHNANIAKGKLSLASHTGLTAGGASGAVVEPGNPDDSLLLEYIRGPDAFMPPEGKPLTASQVAVIEKWIANGAAWPNQRKLSEDHLNDRTWWSLQPIQQPQQPDVSMADESLRTWPRNDIDKYVLSKLLKNGLGPAAEADRRTLIRRVYFDLIGLPPTPQAIESFVNDHRHDAYELLVTELLDSPRYGERWARHWLDVVHYADTHGFDKDKPRLNAWPYRDYVIRSFNEDKAWSQFIREQIAGDVLFPNSRDGIEALGFIAAGPWDFVGHVEVNEDKIDGKIARHLDRDDMVRTTMQSFVGLTVGCAQCHDHKFDPITQEDYYQLQAVFAAVDRADREYDEDPKIAEQRRNLLENVEKTAREIAEIRESATRQVLESVNAIDEEIREIQSRTTNDSIESFGYHSKIESAQDIEKWVQVDLGKPQPIKRIVLHPCHDNFNNIGAGFGFPVRFHVQLSNDPQFRTRDNMVTIADETDRDFANPGSKPVHYESGGEPFQFVRVVASKLATRKNDFMFALAELEVFDTDNINRAADSNVESLDSIESPPRWKRSNLVDGQYVGDSHRINELKLERDEYVLQALSNSDRQRLNKLQSRVDEYRQQMAALPKRSIVYSGTVYSGTGNFKGTGADDGKPRPIHVLRRGDVKHPGKVVSAGAISALGLDHHFDIEFPQLETDRRTALASWLSDRQNPLPWRNIVNRVWQLHFGQGIVATPNDFGKMGATPSHPGLLDYLAFRFREEGQSLKHLHRMILTSATYRQSSIAEGAVAEKAKRMDNDNRLLWRMPRRKLEAEAVRDSILFVSGKLDLSMFGPGYQDFVIEHPEHSPHYQFHLHDPNDPASHRRSIYRFVVRSQLEPFMNSLDCADPSILVGKRNSSVTPQQSLTMMNHGLIVAMANCFAEQLESRHDGISDQIRNGFYEAIGRAPSDYELTKLTAIGRQHGLANACRLIFNLNEFSFVD